MLQRALSRQAFTVLFAISCFWLCNATSGRTAHAEEKEVETIQVGQEIPDFALPGSDGKTHRLSDYKGKQAVVIAWFPKAFTGG